MHLVGARIILRHIRLSQFVSALPDKVEEYQLAAKRSRNTQLHGEFNFGGGRKAMQAKGKLRQSRERKRRGTYRHVIAERFVRSF
jgi:hypothetical protein